MTQWKKLHVPSSTVILLAACAIATPSWHAAACSVAQFMVFFLDGSNKVSPESVKGLRYFLDGRNRKCPAEVTLYGHMDTFEAGEQSAIDVQRAHAVAVEIRRMGFDRWTINVVGVGTSQLIIPTPPRVVEPQNRRVTWEYKSTAVGSTKCTAPYDQISMCGSNCWIELPDGTKCP